MTSPLLYPDFFFDSFFVCLFLSSLIFLFASTCNFLNIFIFSKLSSFFSALRASFQRCFVPCVECFTQISFQYARSSFFIARLFAARKAIARRLKSLLILLLHFTLVFPSQARSPCALLLHINVNNILTVLASRGP